MHQADISNWQELFGDPALLWLSALAALSAFVAAAVTDLRSRSSSDEGPWQYFRPFFRNGVAIAGAHWFVFLFAGKPGHRFSAILLFCGVVGLATLAGVMLAAGLEMLRGAGLAWRTIRCCVLTNRILWASLAYLFVLAAWFSLLDMIGPGLRLAGTFLFGLLAWYFVRGALARSACDGLGWRCLAAGTVFCLHCTAFFVAYQATALLAGASFHGDWALRYFVVGVIAGLAAGAHYAFPSILRRRPPGDG